MSLFYKQFIILNKILPYQLHRRVLHNSCNSIRNNDNQTSIYYQKRYKSTLMESQKELFHSRVAIPEDENSMCQILATAFMHDPVMSQCNLTESDIFEMMGTIAQDIIRDGLCIVTETTELQPRMAGATLVRDFANPLNSNFDKFNERHPVFAKSIAIIDHLETHLKNIYNLPTSGSLSSYKGKFAHLFFIGIHPDFFNRGVATLLNKAFIPHVTKVKGYTVLFAETSGEFSYKLLNKIGFQEKLILKFEDLAKKDTMFQNAVDKGHKGFRLMVLDTTKT